MSHEKYESADIATRKRLPYLVWLNILFFFYFPVSGFGKMVSDPAQYGLFFVAVCGCTLLFPASLILIKAGKYLQAAYIEMVGLFAELSCLAFLTPFEVWNDIYKFGAFLIGAMSIASLVVFSRRQVYIFFFYGLVTIASIVLVKAIPIYKGIDREGGTIVFLFTVLYCSASLGQFLLHNLNRSLISVAESEAELNRKRAEKLGSLIGSVKGALETGQTLKETAGDGLERSDEIRSRLGTLSQSAEDLMRQSASVDTESAEALARANAAMATVDNQNVVIIDSGNSVQRLEGTIREISALAQNRRGEIDSVVKLAEQQNVEMKSLLSGIERIRASSDAVTAAAAGILDVSEKTNLLAMNASIEAAHAGSSGKGFAVISGEIRKLSQETQESTRKINEAIKANDATFYAQTEVMSRFSTGMDNMMGAVKSTAETLSHILDTLDNMTKAAGDLNMSTQSMLGMAQEAKESVLGTVEGIQAGARSASVAKDFAATFSKEVAAILKSFAFMEESVKKAAAVGEESLSRVADLNSGLAAIDENGKDRNQ